MDLRIIVGTKKYLPQLIELYEILVRDESEATGFYDGPFLDLKTRRENVISLLDKFDDPNRTWLVALDKDKVIGSAVLLEWNHFLLKGKIGRLDMLVVNREYRDKGVGKLLVDELEKMAKERGCFSLAVWVLEGNDLAGNLYKKKGFKPLVNEMYKPL